MSATSKQTISPDNRRVKAKTLILRFIKFNLVGFVVFLVGTAVYALLFNTLGFWTWLVANAFGSILQFSLLTYFNKKKKGAMFDI
jgi:putative flippase GtrA